MPKPIGKPSRTLERKPLKSNKPAAKPAPKPVSKPPVAKPEAKPVARVQANPAEGGASNYQPPDKRKRGQAAFANYHAALDWLYNRVNIERMIASRVDPKMFKLDRMRSMLEALGNPHESLKCVHVAGTNGKGSVCAMTTAALRGCGYTVGTYTSPHLVDIRERIAINNHVISHHAFTDGLGRVADAAATLPHRMGEPTFFELVTALGLLYFAEQAVDAAVIEVGLGGLLDSTNVIVPEVSAVTAISLDHTQFLGKTLKEISAQKAGIFKPGVPALTFEQNAEIIGSMREVATKVNAPFQVVGKDIEFSARFEANPQLGPHMRVGLSTPRNLYEHVPVPLPGEHQANNCGLVLAIIDKLSERGFELPPGKVMLGLEQTTIPGRLETLWKQPRVVADGAHNPAAIAALSRTIGAHVPYDSMIMIFGCAADKDIEQMLHQVAHCGDKVIFTKTRGNSRAALPADLARKFNEVSSKMAQTADTLEEALSLASRGVGREDLIFITGSFYLVGEAKKLFAEKAAKAGTGSVATARA